MKRLLLINGAILSRFILCMKKFFSFILMVQLCHEICKRHLCYLHLEKQSKFYDLSSCDLISNNHNQFLAYLGTTHLSPLTVFFFFAKEKIDKNIFNILLNRTCYVTEM